MTQVVTPAAEKISSDEESPQLWPDLSLLGVAIIWGVNIPVMKVGLEQLDLLTFNAIRLAVSALALTFFAYRERRKAGWKPAGVAWWQLAIYAAVVGVAYQLLFMAGISRTSAGNTALIIATVPMWTALSARLFLGERLRRMAWCGLLIALGGTTIVAFQKGDVALGRGQLLGNLLILVAALTWSGATVHSRRLLRRISPLQLATTSALCALPVHVALASGSFADAMPALGGISLWMIILFSGVLSSGLAQPMWHYGVRQAGAAHAAVIQNLIPLVSIFAAWSAFGEFPNAAQLGGGAMILGGLVTMRLGR